MQTKALFSRHYLETRLPDHPEWSEDPQPTYEAVRALWQKACQYGDAWNEAQTENEFVRPVLEALGWSFIVQPKARHGGRVTRPDYALFADDDARDAAYPYQGDDDPFYGRALAIAEAKYWGRPLSQMDASGRNTWKAASNPSHQMVSYLVGTRAPWGVLTNGRVWRLYSREVSSVASEYYEIDLSAIFDSPPPTDHETRTTDHETPLTAFKTFWLFFRRDAFLPDPQGRSFLQRVREGSATYARQISDKLKELVFEQVMPEVAGGFVAYRSHELGVQEETEDSLRAIYQASLSLLYKCLFILYAEARGLLPIANPGYREQSLTSLAQWAAERLDRGLPLSAATHATTRYDALLALFHRIDRGDPSLGIPRYNGGLFNPASPENHFLEQHKLSDRAVARAVDTLVRDAGQPVDYAYLDVRNLGAIYEGLLENRLVIANQPPASNVQLVNDKGERKATGSYYTPDYIVEYIVQHTLDPILDERDATFRAAMKRCAGLRRQLRRVSDKTAIGLLREQLDGAERDAREAFLGLKVLDPAMGSGHFLVNAVDHLTDAIILRMQTYHDEHPGVSWEWNPIQQLVERVREDILAEMERQGIRVDAERLNDTAILTRLVMKRCIYGVDLNPMAVELAKVSLWLHSFTIGAPLSFLDHHLRWGNSLIGTDVHTVEQAVQMTPKGQDAQLGAISQFGLFGGPFAGLLDLTGLMTEVAEQADATLADVRQSAEVFDRFQKGLIPYKQVLDLWVSQYFGNDPAREFMTVYGTDILPALRGERQVAEQHQRAIGRARELWREKRFFHWDLEFPEVFVDLRRRDWAENPGFDVVVGNPPYVRQEGLGEDKSLFQEAYQVYHGTADLYVYFIERGLTLARRDGQFGMITSNKFVRANYGAALRRYLAGDMYLKQIVDFALLPVFPSITVRTVILLVEKAPPNGRVALFAPVRTLAFTSLDEEVADVAKTLPAGAFEGDSWSLASVAEITILERMEQGSKPLGEYVGGEIRFGIKTGYNEAFVIDAQTREQLVKEDPKSAEIIKPVVVGSDVDRYGLNFARQYLIWTYIGVDLIRYPAVARHLSQFRDQLERRWDKGDQWYELRPCTYYEDFERPKIIYPDIAASCRFTYDDSGFFSTNTTYFIPRQDLYLLPVLNSSLSYLFFRTHCAALEDAKRRAWLRFFGQYMERFPVRRIAFITPSGERARLVEVGTADAAEFVAGHAEGIVSASSASFSAFSDSRLGRWLDERLSPTHTPDPALVRQHNAGPLNADRQLPEGGPVEQSDAVHDLLAHLAERMIAMNREKQAEVRGFLAWLEREIGAPIDGLTRRTHLRNYLGDYQKGEPHLALEDLLAILRQNRRRIEVDPAARAFQERLAREYEASLGKLRPLKARLAATDQLIDLIVYRLYGLTEDEVAVVEGDR